MSKVMGTGVSVGESTDRESTGRESTDMKRTDTEEGQGETIRGYRYAN